MSGRLLDFTIAGRECWLHNENQGASACISGNREGTWPMLEPSDGSWAMTYGEGRNFYRADIEQVARQFADQPPVTYPQKLDLTIWGKEVWLLRHGVAELPFYLCNQELDQGESKYLTQDGNWLDDGSAPDFATDAEAIAHAQLHADKGIKLPFQIAGRDVWINGDARSDEMVLRRPGATFEYYRADGPEGRWDNVMSGIGDWETDRSGYWYTHPNAQDAALPAFRKAGQPEMNLATLARTPATAPAVPAGPRPPVDLKKLLGATLEALVRLPEPPPNIRGLVLAKTKLLIPEAVTDLAGWLQENVPSGPVLAASPAHVVSATFTTTTTTQAPRPRPPRDIFVEGSYTRNVSGRASFTATETMAGSVSLRASDIEDILVNAGTRQEAVEALEEYVQSNEEFDGDGMEDYEYSDEEVTDSEGAENWDTNASTIIDRYLDEHPELDPDTRDEEQEEPEIVTATDTPVVFEDDDEPEDDEEGEEEEEENPIAVTAEPIPGFPLGIRVMVSEAYPINTISGRHGVVVGWTDDCVGIRFDIANAQFWNLDGLCEDNHGWYVNPTYLTTEEQVPA